MAIDCGGCSLLFLDVHDDHDDDDDDDDDDADDDEKDCGDGTVGLINGHFC